MSSQSSRLPQLPKQPTQPLRQARRPEGSKQPPPSPSTTVGTDFPPCENSACLSWKEQASSDLKRLRKQRNSADDELLALKNFLQEKEAAQSKEAALRENEHERVRLERSRYRTERDELVENKNALTVQLSTAKEHGGTLREELLKDHNRIAELEGELETARASQRDLQLQVERQKKELRTSQVELTGTKSALVNATKSRQDSAGTVKEAQQLADKLSATNETLKLQLQTAQANFAAEKAKLQKLTEANKELAKRPASTQLQAETLKVTRLSTEFSQKQEELLQKQEELRNLQDTLRTESVQRTRAEGELRRCQEELVSLRKLSREHQELQADVDLTSREGEREQGKLRDQITSLEKQIDNLKTTSDLTPFERLVPRETLAGKVRRPATWAGSIDKYYKDFAKYLLALIPTDFHPASLPSSLPELNLAVGNAVTAYVSKASETLAELRLQLSAAESSSPGKRKRSEELEELEQLVTVLRLALR